MGDSWDDDEWDADEIEAKAEASRKEVRSEDEAEDSEDEKRAAEEARVAAARAAMPKPKPKPQPVQYDVPLKDKKAEKERLRKLEEERDQRLAADLFDGCEVSEDVKDKKAAADKAAAEKAVESKVTIVHVDAFDRVTMNTQSELENTLRIAMEKFDNAKAKGAAHFFLTNLFKQLEGELTTAELDALVKSLAATQKEKQVAKTIAVGEKKKMAEKLNKNTKFNRHDEMDVVYGGGGDWDEWDDEDWADWK